jgi:hypothetical protein
MHHPKNVSMPTQKKNVSALPKRGAQAYRRHLAPFECSKDRLLVPHLHRELHDKHFFARSAWRVGPCGSLATAVCAAWPHPYGLFLREFEPRFGPDGATMLHVRKHVEGQVRPKNGLLSGPRGRIFFRQRRQPGEKTKWPGRSRSQRQRRQRALHF